LAGGANLPASVIPFLLRGVNLLGIDSVIQPFAARQTAWARIATDLPMARLNDMVQMVGLGDVPRLAGDILNGAVQGRVVVDVNA
jgi:acrylyl-CoA reductase (NADPH)